MHKIPQRRADRDAKIKKEEEEEDRLRQFYAVVLKMDKERLDYLMTLETEKIKDEKR